MSLKDLINKNLSHWVAGQGPERDIVLSSRIRLARNLDTIPYPNRADKDSKEEVTKRVLDATSKQGKIKLHYIKMDDLPEVEREVLVEKHLISPAHAKAGEGKGVLLNDNETISIMINEEDHLRLQVLIPGLQLEGAWETASELDDLLEEKLDFAFSQKWGYLSACPTNVGTGLRASVMVHLPALNLTNNINKMLGAISKVGLTVRGIYGEGSEYVGNLYQISNQVTLGHTEKEIIANLKSVTSQIIEQERQARNLLLKEKEIEVRDRVNRSFGILSHAYQISSEEALRMLSNVKLGIDMGIITDVDTGVLSELMVLIRPAHLQKLEGKELTPTERDIKRAELIKTRLNM
ncbi:protein arginine kinase [Halothermothrix orenii]|uniref:Protein-arginine kinase n=1 Tax=Halothermothrix orenii (strain H 168 / OCM 544 / DSM 9562) TaxID=373903 RepID=MCSB_HALOH|nr:protein arginine kinase [Halothermothrix orenii]B8D093.1 RecName: Full=Protein-arginine kinase [Halothermothrix orenii H 168]ACL68847.1 Arginine kinase [Halothermothrix orenii H 168]